MALPRHIVRALLLAILIVLFPVADTPPAHSAENGWSTAELVGGSVNDLVIDPVTPTSLYAAVGRSVFRTTNSGGEWAAVLTATQDMQAVAVASSGSSTTIYAGSERHVWRSTDGGSNWTEMSAGLLADVLVLAVAPSTHELWAGTTKGVWRYTSAWVRVGSGPEKVWALAFGPTTIYAGSELGLFRSFDSGQSWSYTPVIPGSLPTLQQNNIRSIVINPVAPQIVLTGSWYGGIYISGNGGNTWDLMTSAPHDPQFEFLHFTDLEYVQSDIPNQPPILYAATQSDTIDGTMPAKGIPRSGVFRRDDDNANWVPVSNGLANRYITKLAPHPKLPGMVYAGTLGSGIWLKTSTSSDWVQQSIGLSALSVNTFVRSGPTLFAGTTGDGVHRSNDNGLTWTRVGRGMPQMQNIIRALTVDDRGILWAGHSRYGLFQLQGDTWVEVNANTFRATNVSAITSIGPNVIVAYRFNEQPDRRTVVLSEDRGANWRPITNGLPSNVEVHRLTTQLTSDSIVVWASTGKGLFRAPPSASQWEAVGASAGLGMTDVRGLIVDLNNPNVLYAVGSSVFKSLDGGGSWSPRNQGLSGAPFVDLAIDPANAQRIYLAGSSGILHWNQLLGRWTSLKPGGAEQSQTVVVTITEIVFAGASNGAWRYVPDDIPTPPPPPRTKWGVLVYLNGDNDLDFETVKVFDRLEQAASNPAICIDVLWDRLNGPTNEYLIQPDTTPGVSASTYLLNQTYWEYGELDMGARSTFETYLPRARTRCLADYYFVSVVDHGGGWAPQAVLDLPSRGRYKIGSGGGLSWDDTSGKNRMGTRDMQLALESATAGGRPFDVLFYDACLMGTFEDAYAARRSATYFVASANIAWGVFPYDRYLQSITPTTTPEQLAQQIVSIYAAMLPGEPYTMAAYDLRRANAAAASLRSLAQALATQLPANSAKIHTIFGATQKYDSDNDDRLTTKDTIVDVVDLANRLAAEFPGTTVASAATVLREQLLTGSDPFIVKYAAQSSLPDDSIEYDHNSARGLSIYFPLGLRDMRRYPTYVEPNGQIEFATDTGWGSIISSLRRSSTQLAPDPISDPAPTLPIFRHYAYLPLTGRLGR